MDDLVESAGESTEDDDVALHLRWSLAELLMVGTGGTYPVGLGLKVGETFGTFHEIGRVLILVLDYSDTLLTQYSLRHAPGMLQTYLGQVILFYVVSDGIKVALNYVRKESARRHAFSFSMRRNMYPKHLVLRSSNSPENESYNRFAPPSAQALQEDVFQSLHRSPREKGWLSIMRADFLVVICPSRKDGAHLRGTICRVKDTSKGIQWIRGFRVAAFSVPTLFRRPHAILAG